MKRLPVDMMVGMSLQAFIASSLAEAKIIELTPSSQTFAGMFFLSLAILFTVIHLIVKRTP